MSDGTVVCLGLLPVEPADCARCHVPPLFTEPGWSMHTAKEIKVLKLDLTDVEKKDLIEYLKSI